MSVAAFASFSPELSYILLPMAGEPVERDDVSSALEAHVQRFEGLLRHARRRHGLAEADLDELVQEVRVRLWRSQRSGEKISAVSASYMYRTAMSAAVDLIRRRRSEYRDTSLSTEEGRADVSRIAEPGGDLLDQQELAQEIEAALASLPRPRAVAVRMHLAGYGRDEIATLLGWTEAKARNLIYRGLSDLRIALAERGLEPETRR